MLPVSRPSLPPLAEFERLLEDIWSTRMLSNFGKYARRLEEKTQAYLSNPFARCVVNGDIVTFAPVAALILIACHATAQGILQSQGPLSIQVHTAQGISRIVFAEGTGPQWQNLFAGDILFSAPILMAWFLSRFLRPKQPTA